MGTGTMKIQKKKIFFLFVDGVGVGEPGNPISDLFAPFIGPGKFHRQALPYRDSELYLKPIDARLGVPGLPQSGSGQTTIMTGVNAPRLLGYHLLAFPNEKLLPVIAERSILKVLKEGGVRVSSANLYSHSFVEERRKRHRNMLPVSTLAIQAAEIPLRYQEDYAAGKAVFADITNEMLIRRGFPVQTLDPEGAARRILNIFDDQDFVFFEYFLTDTYGHNRDAERLRQATSLLNDFLRSLWQQGREEISILVTSDHGNAEDMSSGDHSLNGVPFFFLSSELGRHLELCEQVQDLTGIHPFIRDCFGVDHG